MWESELIAGSHKDDVAFQLRERVCIYTNDALPAHKLWGYIAHHNKFEFIDHLSFVIAFLPHSSSYPNAKPTRNLDELAI